MENKTFVPIKFENINYNLVDGVVYQEDNFVKLTMPTKKKLSGVILLKKSSKVVWISHTPKTQMLLPGTFVKTKKAECKIILKNVPIDEAERVIIDPKMQFEIVVLTKATFLVFKQIKNNKNQIFVLEATYVEDLYEPNHEYFETKKYECTKCSKFSGMLFCDQSSQYCYDCVDNIEKFCNGKCFYNEVMGDFTRRAEPPILLKEENEDYIISADNRLYVPINKFENYDCQYQEVAVTDLNPFYKKFDQKELTICNYIFI